MRIALAQINPILGDFKFNSEKIIDFIKRGAEKRAHLVVFSELALSGYPPNDALERAEFVAREEPFIKKIVKAIPSGTTVIFGAVVKNKRRDGKPYQNVAVIAVRNKVLALVPKQNLPSYDVFDETRFFEPGKNTGIFKIPQIGKVAFTVCEDMWVDLEEQGQKIYSNNPLAKAKGVDLIVNISASPFSKNKMKARLAEAKGHCKKIRVPFVYVNQVGGQDELIFDGRSFILDKDGKMVVQGAHCEEDLVISDLAKQRSEHRPKEDNPTEILRKSLILGLRDFVRKTNQKRVHLGLSGGIDSAVVAALAVDALGPGQVTGLLLPGPHSSKGSVDDSVALAKNLGIKTLKVDINPTYDETLRAIKEFEKESQDDFTEQNIQARIRGLLLMAFSNRTGSMLLSTANKCELATGYATLYGDTCGGLMPVGDLTKGEIYVLAELYNAHREVIPRVIIDKAPSAELAPNQRDEDSLPPYNELDRAVVNIIEERRVAKTKTEKWLVQALNKSEFKRWQSPPILRVSDHGFGRGRRMPIALKLS